MTNVTERIKDGIGRAVQFLENGDSVRRACQKAGISVTSLYNNTTQSEREQAYLKNTSPASYAIPRGRGRPRKVKARPQQLESNDVNELKRQLLEANEYISKLEHKLVQTVVLS